MQENRTRVFEDSVHFDNPIFEPSNVMVDSPAKTVFKAANLATVAPNNFVGSVAKKRRVEVNQVYAFAVELFEYF